MKNNPIVRPTFLTLWLETLAEHARSGKAHRLVPYWIILFLLIGSVVQRFIATKFYTDSSVGIPIYAGILTLNGLLLTLAWNAFAKIFENICSPKFSTYLRENDLFSVYLYQITYVQLSQVVAVVLSGAALIMLSVANPLENFNEHLFILVIASSGYALKEAVGAVTMLNDLIWYRSIFDADVEAKSANTSVLPMRARPIN